MVWFRSESRWLTGLRGLGFLKVKGVMGFLGRVWALGARVWDLIRGSRSIRVGFRI